MNSCIELYKGITSRLRYEDGKVYYIDGRNKGLRAGKFNKRYRQLRFKGKTLQEHRVIFFMHHGYLPEQVDHIDRDKLNNHIENLREADSSLNQHNKGVFKNSVTGFKGVSKHGLRFRAYINLNKIRHNIGTFDSAVEANEARLAYQKTLTIGGK